LLLIVPVYSIGSSKSSSDSIATLDGVNGSGVVVTLCGSEVNRPGTDAQRAHYRSTDSRSIRSDLGLSIGLLYFPSAVMMLMALVSVPA